MRKAIIWLYIPLLISTILVLATFAAVYAVNVDISGNGAGSSNSVNYNSTQNTSIDQNNRANISNNIDANCNTGGNNASGNTGGNTGNCDVNVDVTNRVNSNRGGVTCCASQAPKASPTPANGGNPPGSPNPGPGNGPDNGSADGGAGNQGSSAQILGSTGALDATLFGGAGLFSTALGLWQAQRALGRKASTKS